MKKSTKIAIITALVLIVSGAALFTVSMYFSGWDPAKLSIVKFESKTYEISENFKEISIEAETEEITFLPSSDNKCKIVCFEVENVSHSAKADGNLLKINTNDDRKWYERMLFSFQSPQMTVYIPEGEYERLSIKSSTGKIRIPKEFSFDSLDINCSTGNVTCLSSVKQKATVKTSTGNITLKSISAGELDLSATTGSIFLENIDCAGKIGAEVSTGAVRLDNVLCEKLSSSGSTGNLFLKETVCSGEFYASRSTGNVTFEVFDAENLTVKTSTGNVSGTLKSQKIFITDTSAGNVSVPKTMSGGKCEIKTSTGNIRIYIKDLQ